MEKKWSIEALQTICNALFICTRNSYFFDSAEKKWFKLNTR